MTDSAPARVTSIILNWNGWRDTERCLRSLAGISGADHQAIVVDNGSTDDSVTQLKREFPWLRIIENGRNLGFAAGVNRGLEAALADGAEFVWLLNNDATAEAGTLNALLSVLRQRPDAGLACSKVLRADRPDVIWFAGGHYDTPSGHVVHLGDGERDRGQHDRIRELDFASGCSLLARRETLEDIGPMPEHFFLYWEDVAWSVMTRSAGWKVLFAPASRVWHAIGASLPSGSAPFHPLRAHYEMRNRVLFHRQCHPGRLPRILLHSIAHALMMSKSRVWFPCAMAHWRGIRDGLLGRTGEIQVRKRRSPRAAE